jgi:Tfp pilus assembly protein PilX
MTPTTDLESGGRTAGADKRQQGMALFVTALMLAVVGLLTLTSFDRAEQETTAGARSRSTTRTLHAADSGVQLALNRFMQSPPNLSAFDITLADGANLQSRARTEGTAQDVAQVGLGDPGEGFGVNTGTGVTAVSRVYEITVTATSGGSIAEVQARISRLEADAVGY